MKKITKRRGSIGLVRGLAQVLVFTAVGAGLLMAKDPSWREKPRKVVDSFEVITGGRSIVYDRLETPELLPEATPVPPPPAAVQAAPTVAELEEMRRWESMDFVALFLSCTVYDGQWSEVRFLLEKEEVVFWSTIDFRHFTPMNELETLKTHYSLFLSAGPATRAEFEEWNAANRRSGRQDLVRKWPTDLLNAAKATRQPQWRIVSARKVPQAAKRAIEDLHAHYAKNALDMAKRYAAQEAAIRAQEEWARKNPPKPRNTRVEYFPIPVPKNTPARPTASPNPTSLRP